VTSINFTDNTYKSYNGSAFWYNFSNNGTSAIDQDTLGCLYNETNDNAAINLTVTFYTNNTNNSIRLWVDDDCTRAGATWINQSVNASFNVLTSATNQYCSWLDMVDVSFTASPDSISLARSYS